MRCARKCEICTVNCTSVSRERIRVRMEGPSPYWQGLLAELPPTFTAANRKWLQTNMKSIADAVMRNPVVMQQLELGAAANMLTAGRTAVCYTLTLPQCKDLEGITRLDMVEHSHVGPESEVVTAEHVAGGLLSKPCIIVVKLCIVVTSNQRNLSMCFVRNTIGDFRVCESCGKIGHTQEAFKMCSRCRISFYCGPECQRTDWPDHKQSCKK